jgi:Family of unknown function (DUF6131)
LASAAAAAARSTAREICFKLKVRRPKLIVLGICLLIIAAIIPKLAVLWGVGIIVLVVGLILLILGRTGRAVGGRRHYY